MKTYADTSFLVPLFLHESTSSRALAATRHLREPLPLVFLNSVEWVNAINARLHRREITAAIRENALTLWGSYLSDGVLVRRDLDTEALRQAAESLSHQHTPTLGVRSLDLLHVAAALVLGCKTFWSFDERQIALARAAGLSTGPA